MSVLITGETGVGKDVLAHRIHDESPRAARPFVAVNCASFCDNLIDSELFGHERGAFTGADKAKMGLLEASDGGTLFLDEIGELSPQAQAKLLRVLECRCVLRVGAVATRPIDVRFIAATNRDLVGDVSKGQFRNDLLFRLDGIRLSLPPLRDRPWEILPAAREFLAEQARREGTTQPIIGEDAAATLNEHGWPGNFRELRNVMERAFVLCDEGLIRPEDLGLLPDRQVGAVHLGSLGGLSRGQIVAALQRCAGNQTRAAAMLGISRRTLIARVQAFDIPRPQARPREINTV